MHRRAIFMTSIAGGAAPTYTISGTVYDADGTTAVASATVALGAYTATSAANGTYTINSIPSGTSGSMTCTKSGYSWTAITISAMAGNLTGQNYTNAWWAAGGIAGSAVGIYRAIGAASLAASYVNLANPGTNDAAPGVAPTWNATNGWISDGTKWLETNLAAASSWSFMIRYSGLTQYQKYICGAKLATGYFGYQPIYSAVPASDRRTFYNSNNKVTTGAQPTSGIAGIAGTIGYYNGVQDVTGLSSSTNSVTFKIFQMGDLTSDRQDGNIQALAIYNSTLTPTQMAALYAAMAALNP